MGTPVDPITDPDPVPVGTDCDICWAEGKPFFGRRTPSSLVLYFSGINLASDWLPGNGAPIDGMFDLSQSILSPCFFGLVTDNYTMTCLFDSTETLVYVESAEGFVQFESPNSEPCTLLILNEQDFKFVSGSCQIILPGTE